MTDSRTVEQIAYLVGTLVIPIGLLILGVVLGFALAKKSEGKKFNFLPFAICWGIVILSGIGRMANTGNQDGSSPIAPDIQVQVIESAAPANAVLLHLNAEKEEGLKARLVNSAKDQLTKVNESTAGIKAEVSYFLDKPQILITATVSTNEGIIEAHTIALKDGKQFEIVCIPNESLRKSFGLLTGKCGEKIKVTLGDSYAALLKASQ